MRSRLKWAGHVERTGDEKLTEIRCLGFGGKGRREITGVRLEDCVKRDLERAGGEWRKTAKKRRSWILLIQSWIN